MQNNFRFLLVPVLILCASMARGETTRTMLNKFSDDILDTWSKFPTEAQKVAREQHMTDLNSTFTTNITKAEPPPGENMQKIFTRFLENLDQIRTIFKSEKMKTDRDRYIKACGLAFKREVKLASDYADERTVYQVFQMMMNFSESARDKLHALPEAIITEGYQGLNAISTEIAQHASIPDNVDHTVKYDENLKEIHRRFSVKTPADQKRNAALASTLESLAKNIQQRCYKKI